MSITGPDDDTSEAQAFGALFKMDVLGLAQADPSTGRLLRVNQCFADMLDLPPSALVGRPFLEITHPDDREANWSGFQQKVRGEIPTFHVEKRLLRRDGSARWVLMNVSLLRDAAGRPDRTVAAVMDLSARKAVEEALARSEQRLQMALETAQLGLWQWTLDTGRVDCSPEVFRIIGLDPAAAHDVQAFRRLVHPQDVDVIWEADEAARTGRPLHAEYRIQRPDGQERWVAHHARTEHDAQGRPFRMVGTLADITGRKQAEEALRCARDALEAHVHERTEALALANMQLVNEVAERHATEAQVRELFGQLVTAEEEERRRLAREVHDSMGQHVTALTLGLKAVQADPGLPAALRTRLDRLLNAAGRLDRDLDHLAYRLRPPCWTTWAWTTHCASWPAPGRWTAASPWTPTSRGCAAGASGRRWRPPCTAWFRRR